MKADTLNLYRDRLDKARRELATFMEGMSSTDARYSRADEIFNAGRELANILYGDSMMPSTIEVSNRIQVFEKRVLRLVGKMEEETDAATVVENKGSINVQESIANLSETSSKYIGMSLIGKAQQQLMEAHTILCSGHRALRNLLELKALEDASKGLNLVMQNINKLEL